MTDPFAPPPSDAVAVGAGRFTLDVIVSAGEPPTLARAQAGGTCGNVLTDLACLGWQSYPLADFGDDDPGRRYRRDLTRFGVRLDLIRQYSDQETPIIVHHLRDLEEGAAHSFTSDCPFCGRRLQYYEPVPLVRVEERLPLVPDARVYFFDRDSEGSLRLARHCRELGALVVYEPNWAGPESMLDEALAVAHVFKFSRERLERLDERHALDGPRLVIETLGRDGLRFRDRSRPDACWRHQPAFPVERLRDAGGSGDWCTAGFLHLVGRDGARGFEQAPPEELAEALRFGQALAAWNCAFEGARGGAYAVAPERWRDDVRRILAGEIFDPGAAVDAGVLDPAGRFCPGCEGGAV